VMALVATLTVVLAVTVAVMAVVVLGGVAI
jgi:hypothetical protein